MVWQRVKECLRGTINQGAYDLWIKPIQVVRCEEECFYLSSGMDIYFDSFVRQNYTSAILASLKEQGVKEPKIIFCDEGAPPQKSLPISVKSTAGTQLRLPNIPQNNRQVRVLHPRYTFDEFMVGESNVLAESACRSMVLDDGLVGPCLFINSETGLGKSHLTHAVAHKVYAESPMTRLQYLTANQFASEMVRGIQTGTMDAFKQKYHEGCDILLVEDVHSLTGKKKTQEELNEVLDVLIKSGKRVILTANSDPRDLMGIDNEFRSRMSGGLVTSINAPDLKTRMRIVEKKAARQQLPLDEESVDYLANRIKGDVRKIESALLALGAKSKLNGGEVGMDLIREVVRSVAGNPQGLTTQMIMELVSSQFKVSIKEMQSKSRKRVITFPRQISMYLSRKFTDQSLAEIGKSFNRDHSTVLHSIKVVSNKLVRDTSVSAQMELLCNKVERM